MPQTASISTLDPAIRKNRAVTGVVTLTHNGAPVVGQDVIIEQKQHAFLFGSGWGGTSVPLANGELTGERKALLRPSPETRFWLRPAAQGYEVAVARREASLTPATGENRQICGCRQGAHHPP